MPDKLDEIRTWRQGRFTDKKRYRSWSEEDKQNAELRESLIVRPSAEGNAICKCKCPAHAKWIADRLNLVSKLEQQLKELRDG